MMGMMSGEASAQHGTEEIVGEGKRAELVPAVATETLNLGAGCRGGE